MVVRYFTDLFSEDFLANMFNPDGSVNRTAEGYPTRCRTDFSIGFHNNKTPTENDVKELINRHAPRQWFAIQEGIFNKEYDLSNIKHKIGETGEVEDIAPLNK